MLVASPKNGKGQKKMKRLDNPSALTIRAKKRVFTATLENLKNDTNGNGRRKVIISWKEGGYTFARAYIVKVSFRSEEEIARDTIQRMLEGWKK